MLTIILVAAITFALGAALAGTASHFITTAKAAAESAAADVRAELSLRLDQIESKIAPAASAVETDVKALFEPAPQPEAPAAAAEPVPAEPPAPAVTVCATCGQPIPAANG